MRPPNHRAVDCEHIYRCRSSLLIPTPLHSNSQHDPHFWELHCWSTGNSAPTATSQQPLWGPSITRPLPRQLSWPGGHRRPMGCVYYRSRQTIHRNVWDCRLAREDQIRMYMSDRYDCDQWGEGFRLASGSPSLLDESSERSGGGWVCSRLRTNLRRAWDWEQSDSHHKWWRVFSWSPHTWHWNNQSDRCWLKVFCHFFLQKSKLTHSDSYTTDPHCPRVREWWLKYLSRQDNKGKLDLKLNKKIYLHDIQ